jgi:putative methionine-R-sulfoxide reductase with GAF domain/HAMP domain-containing protein
MENEANNRNFIQSFINFRDWNISLKIKSILILVSALSALAIGIISYLNNRSALKKSSFSQLTAIRETKKRAVEDYFTRINNQIKTFSESRMIVDAMKEFNAAFNGLPNYVESKYGYHELGILENSVKNYYESQFLPRLNKNLESEMSVENYWTDDIRTTFLQYFYISNNPNETGSKHHLNKAIDGSNYSEVHGKYHPLIKNYLEKFKYYDIFLVEPETGHIVYSVFKEVDYTTSLISGPYGNTNFARAFDFANTAKSKDYVKLVDFAPYDPSYTAPASFIASPIYDGDRKIGVLIFQMPSDEINSIMTGDRNWKEDGLGESGETYLIGDDYYMRSISRFLIEDPEGYFKALRNVNVKDKIIEKIEQLNTTILLQEVKSEAAKAAINGISGEKIVKDYRGINVLSAYSPVDIGGVNWAILSEIDESETFSPIRRFRNNVILTFLVILVLIVLAGNIFSNAFSGRINKVKNSVKTLARGESIKLLTVKSKDEIGETMGEVNNLSLRIMEASDFATNMGKGNYEKEFKPFSHNDLLGVSLNEMKGSLVGAREEELKRKEEDDKRAWVNQGIAKFSELLRLDNDNIEKLGYRIVSHSVEYLNANQASIFVVEKNEENEEVLELKAAHAYDQQKFLKKRIAFGEGMAGAVAKEKKTKLIKNVPDDYIQITSGLGKSNPRNILIVPLMMEDNVLGLLEIASFNEFKPHEVGFIEQVAESIATTINTVKINEQTAILLKESEDKANELAQQEEEMRQNMEELEATQEEVQRVKKQEEDRHQAAIQALKDELEEMKKTNVELEKKLSKK